MVGKDQNPLLPKKFFLYNKKKKFWWVRFYLHSISIHWWGGLGFHGLYKPVECQYFLWQGMKMLMNNALVVDWKPFPCFVASDLGSKRSLRNEEREKNEVGIFIAVYHSTSWLASCIPRPPLHNEAVIKTRGVVPHSSGRIPCSREQQGRQNPFR